MSSPLSDIGVSLAQTAILRILEDARNAESKLNRQLTEDGKPTLEPFFFTRDQMAEVVASHESAIAKLKPQPSKWEGWRERQRRDAPSPLARLDAEVFVDMVAAALRDPRIGGRRLREGLRILLLTFRPCGLYGGKIEVPADRARAVAQWCDAVASMPVPPKDERTSFRNEVVTHDVQPRPTDADLTRAAALASGIESGEVVPLDRDATAKFIRESMRQAEEPRT